MGNIYYETYYGTSPSLSDYVAHSGIKGMKWYHRRYQNPDGSLTPLGRLRYGVGPARKAKTMDEVKAAQEKQAEDKRVKYSGKMKEKYKLIDIPKNKDAAWDNARDMYEHSAKNSELNKYLKLNGFDKKDVAKLKAEEAEHMKAQKERQAKREREADKADAIAKGDAKRIAKYASEMSTNDLRDAVARVQMNKQLSDLMKPEKTNSESMLKKVTNFGNDIANAGAAVKRVKDLFQKEESETDKAKKQAYNESLKSTASNDAGMIRKLAEKAGLSAKEAEMIAKDRYEQLYNGKDPSKEYKELMKKSGSADTDSDTGKVPYFTNGKVYAGLNPSSGRYSYGSGSNPLKRKLSTITSDENQKAVDDFLSGYKTVASRRVSTLGTYGKGIDFGKTELLTNHFTPTFWNNSEEEKKKK